MQIMNNFVQIRIVIFVFLFYLIIYWQGEHHFIMQKTLKYCDFTRYQNKNSFEEYL